MWNTMAENRLFSDYGSAREIASVALSAEQERHSENVFHIVLTSERNLISCEKLFKNSKNLKQIGQL